MPTCAASPPTPRARDLSADIARGLVITMVVMGHCSSVDRLGLRLIGAFHMPFFFLQSGALTARRDTDRGGGGGGERTLQDVASRVKLRAAASTLIPYFIFDSLFALYTGVIGHLDAPREILPALLSSARSILTLNGTTVTWFLPALLLAKVAFVLISRSRALALPLTAAIFLAGLLVPCPPYCAVLWRAAVGLGFFTMGVLLAPIAMKKWRLLPTIALAALFVPIALANGSVGIVSLSFGNPVRFVAAALLGSALVVQVSIRLAHAFCGEGKRAPVLRLLARFGESSLVILCTHPFLIEPLRLLDYKLFGSLLPRCGAAEPIVFAALVMALECAVIPLAHRPFAPLFGRRNTPRKDPAHE